MFGLIEMVDLIEPANADEIENAGWRHLDMWSRGAGLRRDR